MSAARIPKHDAAIERAILGAPFWEDADPGACELVLARTRPEHFYIDKNRIIRARMDALRAAGHPVDMLTLVPALKEAGEFDTIGPDYLPLLFEEGAIAAHLPTYIAELHDLWRHRRLEQLGHQLVAQNGAQTGETIAAARAALDSISIDGLADPAPLATGLADFFAAESCRPDPPPLAEHIVSADGAGWIAGEEKLGKTSYALEEASCLALAAPICGRFQVPERQRVVFFCEEDSRRRTYRRLRALIRGKGLDPDDQRLELNEWFRLAVWSGLRLDDPAMLARLEAEHAAFRPAVAYYDSLRKITRRDLNKTFEAEAFLDVLDGLRRTYGTLARVVAHNRKISGGGFRTGRGSQEIAGSHVLGAWGECSLFFEPIGRQGTAVRVAVQSKDWAPMPPFRLVIESTGPRENPETLTLRAADDDRSVDADERVLDAVASLPAEEPISGQPGVPKHAVATYLKCSEKTVQRALTRLEGTGRLSVTGYLSKKRPLYAVPAK